MTWPSEKAAFVTGAASGIGLGISRALVAAGAKVALADIDGDRAESVAKELADIGGTVVPVQLDVADAGSWESAADEAEKALGPISILCNNAGVNGGGLLDETPLEVWRWVLKINADAQFIGVSTFLPRFKGRGGRAHIVNTASMAGLVPMVNAGAYTASKFASLGMSLVLRDEVADSDVGVSVLCPGTVATRLSETAAKAQADLLGEEMNQAAVDANGALLSQGADPDRVGEQVLEAMQQHQFLIFTHREWGPLVNRVYGEIDTAFKEFDGRHGPDPTAQMIAGGTDPVSS